MVNHSSGPCSHRTWLEVTVRVFLGLRLIYMRIFRFVADIAWISPDLQRFVPFWHDWLSARLPQTPLLCQSFPRC